MAQQTSSLCVRYKVDLEIQNFRVLVFHVGDLRYRMYFMFPGLVIWNKTIHAKITLRTNSLLCLWLPYSCCKLLACEKELGNTVGIYCGSKDKYDLSDTKKVVTHLPPVTYGYRTRGHLTQNN